MTNIERNIFFHVKTLKKVRFLTLEILSDLKAGELDRALEKIQSRDRLLNVIFDLHKIIENGIKGISDPDQKDLLLIKAWRLDLKSWSQSQSLQNDEVEELLRVEKIKTTNEIAIIFDQKSRHKGYDLTNVK